MSDDQVMAEKIAILKQMDMENLVPVGPSVIQSTAELHSEVVRDMRAAAVLMGTDIVIENWYHDKTGTYSRAAVFDHNYLSTLRDKDGDIWGYVGDPSEEWLRKQIGKEKCPVWECEYLIPISYTIDETVLAGIGLKPIDPEKQRRAATLYHIKTAHPMAWSAIVTSGQITKSEIDELGK